MLLKLAWRNIWRNKRRSVIILTSIIVGMSCIVFIDSFDRGLLKQMFENQLGAHMAHIQIHKRGFNDNKVVQNYMSDPSRVAAALDSVQGVEHHSRRAIAFGLLSSASNSSGVFLVGVEPNGEAKITIIKACIIEGRYVGDDPHEIVMGKRLASTLDVGLGGRVVAMASTLDGKIGSEMFRIVGLYQSPILSIDKANVYVPFKSVQQMLGVGDQIAEIAIIVQNPDSVTQIKHKIMANLDDSYEILSYQDLMPMIISQLDAAEQLLFIFYFIIGLAMVFGVINTMLMSVFERIHEFGVLKAVGMKDRRLFIMIVLEAFFLGLIGTVIGTGLGIAIDLSLSHSGLNLAAFSEGLASFGMGAIVYPVLKYSSIMAAMAMILGICCAAAMYPAYKAVKLEPVHAMRYV